MAAARMVARATTPVEGGAVVVAAMKTATMTTTATSVVAAATTTKTTTTVTTATVTVRHRRRLSEHEVASKLRHVPASGSEPPFFLGFLGVDLRPKRCEKA